MNAPRPTPAPSKSRLIAALVAVLMNMETTK
jgi:hypothetical protein